MSALPNTDRRSARRQATRAEILEAAWEMVRTDGLAGLSMRDLGQRVGMRAQSIYSYFESKHEIFDAMFLEGYEACAEWMDTAVSTGPVPDDPIAAARRSVHGFVEFCTSDPVRYQLLFQRTIPDFEPSQQSWDVALRVYDVFRERLATIGVHDQATLDLWTAVMTGITDQQISNDPGGDRWTQLVDRAIDMLLADAAEHLPNDHRTTSESEPT